MPSSPARIRAVARAHFPVPAVLIWGEPEAGADVRSTAESLVRTAAQLLEGDEATGLQSLLDRPGTRISLSHSTVTAAALVAAHPEAAAVGLDVEDFGSARADDDVLHPAERRLLARSSDPDRDRLRIRVCKAALLKAGAVTTDALPTTDVSELVTSVDPVAAGAPMGWTVLVSEPVTWWPRQRWGTYAVGRFEDAHGTGAVAWQIKERG